MRKTVNEELIEQFQGSGEFVVNVISSCAEKTSESQPFRYVG
jgi:hypothetical protein